jgi:hypothetical protein
LNFPDRFSKSADIKFHENPSSGSRVVLCGITDGRTQSKRDEANNRFQNFAKAPKKDKNFKTSKNKPYNLVALLAELCNETCCRQVYEITFFKI